MARPFVELHEIPAGPFLQPVQDPLNSSTTAWCINHLSQFCTICKLAEGTPRHSVPSSRLLIKILNNIGLIIDHWGIPLATRLWLDFVTLITTVGAREFSQFSVQLTGLLSSPYFISLSMRMGNLLHCPTVLTAEKIFLTPSLEFSFFNSSLLFLILPPCTTVKSLALSS